MSRLDCALGADENCVAGYDWSLGTYFFHSGREDSQGRPKLRVGETPNHAPNVASLESKIALAAKRPGFVFGAEMRAALIASAAAGIMSAESRGLPPTARASALLAACAGASGEGGHAHP